MGKKKIPYFSLVKSEECKSADIIIFGDIVSKGYVLWDEIFPADVNSFDLVSQLNDIPEDYTITVHINSYGGEVKEGLAIYNALKTRNVTTICEGFAASAASLVFMAGRRRVMNAASLLFIHQAIVSAYGNPDELEKAASDLRTITEAAANAYKEGGVTISDEELTKMLKAETWIKAEDALEMGFATEIADTEETEDDVYTNSAMPAIIAAVAGKQGAKDTICAEFDFSSITESINKFLDQFNEKANNFAALLQPVLMQYANHQPTPIGGTNKRKGFFNFTPEGKGGKQ